MHTHLKVAFHAPRRLVALTALPFLAGLMTLSGDAAAQAQPQPFGPPPGGQPGQFGQPAPGQFGQPAPGQFGQPAPGQFGQPAPGQPGQPGQFGQPPPGQGGQFGQPSPFGQPNQPGQPGQPGGQADGSFRGDASFGTDGAQGDASADASADAKDGMDEDEERALSLMEQPNIWGSTGLLRTSYAGSGAPGTFRVSFLLDWFTTSNFLCDPEALTEGNEFITCGRDGAADEASHVGAFFTLNATPFSFLEAYANIRTYANSNNQGSPQLLQVLGDTTFGVKAFTPPKIGKILTFGGEVQLMLLNGTGDVGVAGGGTSAAFRALASADFRKPNGGAPLRVNLNFAYKLDNSGTLVEDVEIARGKAFTDGRDRQPISRIERYGLGINRVDFIQLYLGVELPFSKVQPFVEYSLDIPANRQGYECYPSRVSRGDVCLGLDKFDLPAEEAKTRGGPGYSAFPSRLSLGLRTNPFSKAFRGLSATAAFDIGLSATSTFIEEVAPQAPWTLFLGLGYAFDTKEKEPPPVPPAPAPVQLPPKIIPAPQNFIRGFVHEQGKADPIPEAIITFASGAQPPIATGGDGRFLTRHLEPGTYSFNVKANGYKPGTCQGTIGLAPQPGGFGAPPSPFGAQPGQPGQPGGFGAQPTPFGQQPGQPGGFGAQPTPFGQQPGQPGGFGAQPTPFGQQPGQPGGFGAQPSPFGQPQPGQPGQPGGFGTQPGMPGPAPSPEVPQGPTVVDVDCPLEALPRLGTVLGTVRDAESGAPIAGAIVRMTDVAGKDVTATSDGNGSFRFADVQPGQANFKVEAGGYMVHANQTEVRANEEARPSLSMNKRPKVALVRVLGNEIKISKQIHFETGSAKILGDSNALMEEIADVLMRNPNIRKVEIQGHTDNTGGRESNQILSDNRAKSVKQWLVSAGIEDARLVAKGYGQDRPLAPNVTAANKAKNRRVQFIILEK
jgi:outer membrane protein OmpA-like peptidoglycan-associated protein